MQITFYCHLYMNENLKKKEAKIKKKLSANKLQPSIYVIAFSQSRGHPFICGRTG